MPSTRGVMLHDHMDCEKNKCDKCKKKMNSLESQRRYAWSVVFTERTTQLENNILLLDELEAHIEKLDIGVSDHLQQFIKKMYKDTKQKVECAICLERIDSKTLKTTKCGHNFHEKCLQQWTNTDKKDCPVCRKKL
tara:strand:- start:202 stop:609 length:408 start_codon:yes stop_codon:yes gene_type:complete